MKITLITGASRGLGKSMALNLAEAGNDIIITYHSQKQMADDLVSSINAMGRKAIAIQLDSSKTEEFADFTEILKRQLHEVWQRRDFDHLINNAGTGLWANFADTSIEQFDAMMNIHLKGPFFLTQTLLPLIRDGGRILNVSSGLTRFTYQGYAAYAIMKGGVETLTHYLAKELGARKISVNTIAPGAIETDFGGGAVRDNKELNQMISASVALGRVGQPDDIGGAVAAILNDKTAWINGQRIEVSGGTTL